MNIDRLKMMVLVDIELRDYNKSYNGNELDLISGYKELDQDDRDEYDVWLMELEAEMNQVMRKVG